MVVIVVGVGVGVGVVFLCIQNGCRSLHPSQLHRPVSVDTLVSSLSRSVPFCGYDGVRV